MKIKIKKEKIDCFIRKIPGFTLIEALLVLFIFSLIVVTFYSLFSVGTKHILESKFRLGATAVANERVEIVRSLEYSQIGTTDGYISGDIPSSDQVTVDGRNFYIFSSVVYIDDPYDGIEDGTPDDSTPTDYKRVTIKVAWENDINSARSVTFTSDFAPPGVEENMGGGTLVIKVMNNSSEGISGASVQVKNDDLGITENLTTDSNGGVSLPGIPADGNDYEISVSKSSYFSIDTLPPYPTSTFYPVYVHASVTENNKNIYSITTDEVSDVTLKTEDPFGSTVQNIDFNLKGGIKKGDTIDNPPDYPAAPIFYYEQDLDSGSSGENSLSDISYGSYILSPIAASESDYEFIKMVPYDTILNDKTRFIVDPGVNITEKAIFADKNINSALITVLDSSSSLPVKGASVRLYNLSLPTPYDATLTTDDFGMVYFPSTLPELSVNSTDYSIEASASGYDDKSDSMTISDYTKKELNIDPS